MALQSQHPTKRSTTIFKFWKLCSVQVSSKGPVSISCPGAPASLSAALDRVIRAGASQINLCTLVMSLTIVLSTVILACLISRVVRMPNKQGGQMKSFLYLMGCMMPQW